MKALIFALALLLPTAAMCSDVKYSTALVLRAQRHHDPAALYALGLCYETGAGVSQDAHKAQQYYRDALKYYQLAVDKKDSVAQFQLGKLFVFGQHVPDAKNPHGFKEILFQMFAKIDKRKHVYGKIVKQDTDKGLDLIEAAANQNYLPAQHFLVRYYIFNEKNFEDGIYWMDVLAKKGDATAQAKLARYYYFGYGVQQDFDKAKHYAKMAAHQNNREGRDILIAIGD